MRGAHTAWLATAALATGCLVIWDDARLTIHNHSSDVITEVRLGDGWTGWWGQNLLRGDLMPDQDAVSPRITCGTYDVLVVDAAGHRCEVDRLYICYDDRDWEIDDGMMSGC